MTKAVNNKMFMQGYAYNRQILTLILSTLMIYSSTFGQVSSTFRNQLVEQRIGESNYYISLPENYAIKKTQGIDFSVYYFLAIDTTQKTNFSGGLYFGNFPSQFGPANDSCKITTVRSKILKKISKWTIYICQGDYTLQTIVEIKDNKDWNELIHAFGRANYEDDINKVLYIYSTLRQKRK